jgi:hypothetical protein
MSMEEEKGRAPTKKLKEPRRTWEKRFHPSREN